MQYVAIEELHKLAGQDVGTSDWLLVDQDRIDHFANATGDFQWIHTDVERSKREMGGTIAHGYLILSLIPLLSVDILSVTGLSRTLNYGLNRLRFTGIVQAGQRIRLRERILSVEPKGEGLLVTYEFVVETEGNDRPVCVAEGLGLMFPA